MKLVFAFNIQLPPTPKGENSSLMGNIGWGVPLGNEGSEAFKCLFNLLYTPSYIYINLSL
jgi:hypothetical protein